MVDSNVLLDIATSDPRWGEWSASALADAADHSILLINPIIYAELSIGFDRIEELDEALPADLFVREPLPWDAGFLAGKAFLAYRRRGVRGPPLFPISISELTQQSPDTHSSRATRVAIVPTFLLSN